MGPTRAKGKTNKTNPVGTAKGILNCTEFGKLLGKCRAILHEQRYNKQIQILLSQRKELEMWLYVCKAC